MIVFQYKEGEWQVVVDGVVRVRTDHSSEMGALCALGMKLTLLAAGAVDEGENVVLGPGVSAEQLQRGVSLSQGLNSEDARAARFGRLAADSPCD